MILLVDDNDDLRDVTCELLESLGHRVVEAQRAESALRIFERRSEEIDLLISELVFPGSLTGLDLAERLQSWKPDLAVLFVSTHDNHGDLKTRIHDHQVAFLRKPYSVEELVNAIRQAVAWNADRAEGSAATPTFRPPSAASASGLPSLTGTPFDPAGDTHPGHDGSKGRTRALKRAGVAGLLVTGLVAGLQFLGLDPPPLPDKVVSSAQRGTWIEPVEPQPHVSRAPRSLRWTPVADAAVYRISILTVDDSPLWQGESTTASAVLPAGARQLLQPRVVYTWLIEAIDANGRTMAHSGRLRFQIRQDRGTAPGQASESPS